MSFGQQLESFDPRIRGEEFSKRVLREAERTRQMESAKIKARQLAESKQFNPLSALVSGAAGFATGGPAGALVGALASPRGTKFKPLSSAVSGAGAGITSGTITGADNSIGSLVSNAMQPGKLGAAGALISQIPEGKSVGKAVQAAGVFTKAFADKETKAKKKKSERVSAQRGTNLIAKIGSTKTDAALEKIVDNALANKSLTEKDRRAVVSKAGTRRTALLRDAKAKKKEQASEVKAVEEDAYLANLDDVDDRRANAKGLETVDQQFLEAVRPYLSALEAANKGGSSKFKNLSVSQRKILDRSINKLVEATKKNVLSSKISGGLFSKNKTEKALLELILKNASLRDLKIELNKDKDYLGQLSGSTKDKL